VQSETRISVRRIVVFLSFGLLLLAAACTPVGADEGAPWRRIPPLEEVLVTYCLGDRSLSWVSRSKIEQRRLFTPEFYRKCSSGTSVFSVWPCCEPGERYAVFRSRRELARHFEAILRDPQRERSLPEGRAWVEAYLETADRHVDFQREVLVLSSTPYGNTGMATASLDFEERDGTLTATIRIRVPPPPLTPDTALFRFAFAVSKMEIDRVKIVVARPGVPDLRVSASSETTASFRIAGP
jgi:hypothetical protein